MGLFDLVGVNESHFSSRYSLYLSLKLLVLTDWSNHYSIWSQNMNIALSG